MSGDFASFCHHGAIFLRVMLSHAITQNRINVLTNHLLSYDECQAFSFSENTINKCEEEDRPFSMIYIYICSNSTSNSTSGASIVGLVYLHIPFKICINTFTGNATFVLKDGDFLSHMSLYY